MSVVKLKEEKQKKLKVLSKIIAIIAKIGRICCYIALVATAIAAIVIPMIMNNTEVKDDEITFAKETIVKMEEEDDTLILKAEDSTIAKITDQEAIKNIKKALKDYKDNKASYIGYVELCLAFVVTTIVLSVFFLKHLEKLFKNINQEDTPFILENVEHIRKMALLMIALIIIPAIISGMIEIIAHSKADINFNLFDVMEVLIMCTLAYIFEYGYEIQKDSKSKIYGE